MSRTFSQPFKIHNAGAPGDVNVHASDTDDRNIIKIGNEEIPEEESAGGTLKTGKLTKGNSNIGKETSHSNKVTNAKIFPSGYDCKCPRKCPEKANRTKGRFRTLDITQKKFWPGRPLEVQTLLTVQQVEKYQGSRSVPEPEFKLQQSANFRVLTQGRLCNSGVTVRLGSRPLLLPVTSLPVQCVSGVLFTLCQPRVWSVSVRTTPVNLSSSLRIFLR
ncbi:hypothetical protein J6590_038718 [Homalodisca vitripennis]|nr:hypothetical protein J6590_038718 [Homalodisca vitripennis]